MTWTGPRILTAPTPFIQITDSHCLPRGSYSISCEIEIIVGAHALEQAVAAVISYLQLNVTVATINRYLAGDA